LSAGVGYCDLYVAVDNTVTRNVGVLAYSWVKGAAVKGASGRGVYPSTDGDKCAMVNFFFWGGGGMKNQFFWGGNEKV